MALALTAGCASMTRVELAPDGIAGLHTIDVVMPPEPQEYAVFMENHPGAAVGGVIGGVIIAADQTAKMNRVKQALQGQHISVSRTMADALIQRLKATGYRVRVVEAPLDRQLVSSVNVTGIASDADALLVIAPRTIGFVTANAFAAYEPTVTAEVTLLGHDRTTVLYRGLHSAGRKPALGEWRNVSTGRTFADVDNLVANPGTTAAALTEAGTAVAQAIADDIRLSAASPAVAARRTGRG
ncbi:MAG TPA: hypothetical protein VII39_05485 [Bradyrhizobium sp.]